MGERIDASVKQVKTPLLQAMIDRPTANAELEQLRSRNHPVLALGELRNRTVLAANRIFTMIVTVNFGLVLHPAIFGAPTALVMRETSRVTRTFVTRRRRRRSRRGLR